MKILVVTLLLLLTQNVFSQEKEKELVLKTDAKKAREQIIQLRNDGALVVRLFLTKKKIELYRQYGNEKLANQLKEKLDFENSLLVTAFSDSTFSFCPVYFIETNDYGRVINGEESGYFLNKNLEVDSSIVMKEDYVLFLERGPVYDQVSVDDSYTTSETSSTPVLFDALVIKDINMVQLVKPFPFFKKIYFADNVTSNTGFYVPTRNNSKGGTWFFTPPVSITEKLALKDKKEEYLNRIAVIEEKTGFTEKQLTSISKNITTYYKNEYGLKKTEVTLPFNIYRLNVKLLNFYYAAIESNEKLDEKAIEKLNKEEEKLKNKTDISK